MKVKVYSTQNCPYCHMLKDFLKDKKIDFEDIDVSKDQEAAQEMINKSGQMGVPVTDIDGEISTLPVASTDERAGHHFRVPVDEADSSTQSQKHFFRQRKSVIVQRPFQSSGFTMLPYKWSKSFKH